MPCTIGLTAKKIRPGNDENSAGFTRGLNSGGLLKKQSPILLFEKQRNLMPPSPPQQARNFSGYLCEEKLRSLGSAPRQRFAQKHETFGDEKTGQGGLRPLTGANPAQTVAFASEGDMVVVLTELFTTLLKRNR